MSDHGPGIPEAELKRNFKVSYRGERTERTATGFGVRLAVCRRVAGTRRPPHPGTAVRGAAAERRRHPYGVIRS